jgi:chromosome segregation ATPase
VRFRDARSAAKHRLRSLRRAVADERARNARAEEAFNAQREQMSALECACEASLKQQKALEANLARITTELEFAKQGHDERIAEVESSHRSLLDEIRDDYARDRAALAGDIAAKDAKIREYSARLQRLEEDVCHWKRTAQFMRKQKKMKEDEVGALAMQFEEGRTHWLQRMETAKQELIARSERVVAVLKGKNRELRRLARQSRADLETAEERVRTLTEKVAAIERKNDAIRLDAESRREEITRDRQLTEAKSRAIGFQLEAKVETMVAEISAKYAEEKRTLFGCLAKYFDGGSNMEDEGLKMALQKLVAELERLRQTDAAIRRLLSLGPGERPEDAVAKLMLLIPRK